MFFPKVTQERLTKFTKILNNIKFSCKIFEPRCWNIRIIYITYKKNQHILIEGNDKKVMTNFGSRYWGILGQKKSHKKNWQSSKRYLN